MNPIFLPGETVVERLATTHPTNDSFNGITRTTTIVSLDHSSDLCFTATGNAYLATTGARPDKRELYRAIHHPRP